MPARKLLIPALVVVAALLTACSSLSWEEKVADLRLAGERGADAHYVLLTKNQEPTRDNCAKNYSLVMGDGQDPPPEFEDRPSSDEWKDLHRSYFVDSCVSGTPRKPQTRPTTQPGSKPSTAPPPSTTSTRR